MKIDSPCRCCCETAYSDHVGSYLDIEPEHALLAVETVHEDLASGHHRLRKLEQNPSLLNEFATIYAQLRLHFLADPILPAGVVPVVSTA